MSRSSGPGYPLDFRCAKLASLWPRDSLDAQRHQVTLTGKIRNTTRGRSHPRKSLASFQYQCSCGHLGWSSHADLERLAVATKVIEPDDPRIVPLWRKS